MRDPIGGMTASAQFWSFEAHDDDPESGRTQMSAVGKQCERTSPLASASP